MHFIYRRNFWELNTSFAAELFMWDKKDRGIWLYLLESCFIEYFWQKHHHNSKKCLAAFYCQKTAPLSDTAATILHICCAHIMGHKNLESKMKANVFFHFSSSWPHKDFYILINSITVFWKLTVLCWYFIKRLACCKQSWICKT